MTRVQQMGVDGASYKKRGLMTCVQQRVDDASAAEGGWSECSRGWMERVQQRADDASAAEWMTRVHQRVRWMTRVQHRDDGTGSGEGR